MKPEDVPQEWVDMGMEAHTLFPRAPRIPMPPFPTSEDARRLLVREIIAAVTPLIAAAEREAFWRDMPPSADEDNKDHAEWARGFNFCLDHLKAVIRAREK